MDLAGVEAEFRRLKVRFESGAMTEADLKARLEELMIEDEQGRWWMIGYETGQWYVHDGEEWVLQPPPLATPGVPEAGRPSGSRPGKTMLITSRPDRKLRREAMSVLLIAAVWVACFTGLGVAVFQNWHYLPWTWGAGAGGMGGLVTGLILRRTDPPPPWKVAPVATIGWAVAMAIGWSLIHGPWMYKGVVLGLIGGLSTAAALKWAHHAVQWKHAALVTLGWVFGWAVGGAVAWSLGIDPYSLDPFSLVLRHALCGAIGGAVGSWVMFWQLRQAAERSP